MFIRSKNFNSIDNCPIGVFQDILRGASLRKLVTKGNPKDKQLIKAWGQIYDEYLKLYGIPDNYQEYCNKKIQAGEVFLQSLEPGQEWRRAIYKLLDSEAEGLIKSTHKNEFEKVLAQTSKMIGFRLNPREITVREFYGYLNSAQGGL